MKDVQKWTQEHLDALKALPAQRTSLHLMTESSVSPHRYYEVIRGYWITGIVFNLVATTLIASAIIVTLTENAKTSVGMSRVDGVNVIEAQDVRREVLLKNSLKRSELQQGSPQK